MYVKFQKRKIKILSKVLEGTNLYALNVQNVCVNESVLSEIVTVEHEKRMYGWKKAECEDGKTLKA